MARNAGTPCDVLFVLTGAPYATDLVTTVLRMVDELLRRDRTVRVWACGYATALTLEALGPSKPRDLSDWAKQLPSTAAVIAGLLHDYPDQLTWEVCRYCAQDRGAGGPHGSPARMRPTARIGTNVELAGTTVYLGGA
jgi:sulfur relay (sulfurtransferase) complex TusBCD TusD component (DsrE family)